MLAMLVAELDVCKAEIYSLRDNQLNTSNAADTTKNEDVEKLKEICQTALRSAEELKSRNEELEKEMKAMKAEKAQSSVGVEEKFISFEKEEKELKDCRFRIESLTQEAESLKAELRFAKEASDLKQTHIDRLNSSLREEQTRNTKEITRLTQCLAEKCFEIDRLTAQNSSFEARIATLTAVSSERDSLLTEYSRRISEECSARKRDCAALTARINVLAQENASLRCVAVQRTANPVNVEQSSHVDGLLEDQGKLIATLKEECELLTARLHSDRIAFKKELKRLKRENKDLSSQVERFIAGT